jgi:hypothetical protein
MAGKLEKGTGKNLLGMFERLKFERLNVQRLNV